MSRSEHSPFLIALIVVLASGAVACGSSDGGETSLDATPGDADAGKRDDAGARDPDARLPADADPDAPDAGPPRIEVGTGFRDFEPVEPGQSVAIVRGIQGGIHVWGGFRGAGFEPTGLEMTFRLIDEAGEQVGGAQYIDDVFEGPSGDLEYSAVAVIFDSDEPDPYSGRPMTLTLEIAASDGTMLSDAVELVPECCE